MSGRKNTLLSFQNIISGNMALTSITSAVTSIQFLDNIGVQLNFTGTPTGTFDIQVSADYAQDSFGNVTNAGNWIGLTFGTAPVASGAASTIYLDLNQLSAPWLRVVYTKTSGTGTLNGFVTGKML